MDTSKEYHRNLRALSLHYEDVVDQMFIQLDGLSFVERAYQELRTKCYKAAHSYNDKPSYYAAQRQAGSVSSAWRGCRRTAGAADNHAAKEYGAT